MERETFHAKLHHLLPFECSFVTVLKYHNAVQSAAGHLQRRCNGEDDFRLSDSGRHSRGDPDVNSGSSRPDRQHSESLVCHHISGQHVYSRRTP